MKIAFIILTAIVMILNGFNGLRWHSRLHKSETLSNKEIDLMRSYIFWSALIWIILAFQIILVNT